MRENPVTRKTKGNAEKAPKFFQDDAGQRSIVAVASVLPLKFVALCGERKG